MGNPIRIVLLVALLVFSQAADVCADEMLMPGESTTPFADTTLGVKRARSSPAFVPAVDGNFAADVSGRQCNRLSLRCGACG